MQKPSLYKLLDLLTREELKQLCHNYEANQNMLQTGLKPQSFSPVVRFFNPIERKAWYLNELSPDNIGFGICQSLEVKLSYICLAELSSIKLPKGLSIEKEYNFSAKGLSLDQWYAYLKNLK